MKTENVIQTYAVKYMRFKDQFQLIPTEELALFSKEVIEAYDRIFNSGHFVPEIIRSVVSIEYMTGNPYNNLESLTQDCTENGTLQVSTDNNNSQLLPGDLNLKFRAIHDYLHYQFQQPFGFAGEFNVYKIQKFMHSTEIGKRILFSEVVLQAAYCEHFKGFAPVQKVIFQ